MTCACVICQNSSVVCNRICFVNDRRTSLNGWFEACQRDWLTKVITGYLFKTPGRLPRNRMPDGASVFTSHHVNNTSWSSVCRVTSKLISEQYCDRVGRQIPNLCFMTHRHDRVQTELNLYGTGRHFIPACN